MRHLQTKQIWSIPLRRAIVALGGICFFFVLCTSARGEEVVAVQVRSKVAGLPIGIVQEALTSSDAASRQRLLTLLAQRVQRNSAAKQRLLLADPSEIAAILAPYPRSTQMLESARNMTNDVQVRGKLLQVIAAIELLQTAVQ
jgi:hypothetical protein